MYKVSALKTKPNKKDRHYKVKSYSSKSKEQFANKEPQMRDHSVDNESTLVKFAKQNFGVEISIDANCPDDNIQPFGKGKFVPSGKSAFSRR